MRKKLVSALALAVMALALLFSAGRPTASAIQQDPNGQGCEQRLEAAYRYYDSCVQRCSGLPEGDRANECFQQCRETFSHIAGPCLGIAPAASGNR